MKLLRQATLEEVLAVAPEDPATRNVVRDFTPYSHCLFDLADVGDVHVQLHDEPAPSRPIRETFDLWLQAARGDVASAVRDRRAHETLKGVLLADGKFRDPPIIRSQPTPRGPRKWISDGAHRFLAVFDLGRSGKLPKTFEMPVFWGQASP